MVSDAKPPNSSNLVGFHTNVRPEEAVVLDRAGCRHHFGKQRAGLRNQHFQWQPGVRQRVNLLENPAAARRVVGMAAEGGDGLAEVARHFRESDRAFAREALEIERAFAGEDMIGVVNAGFQIQQIG